MPRILLVEDHIGVRAVFEDILIDEGYEVDTTQTIRDGEELLRRSTYDLLIVDGQLPDGTGMVLADQAAKSDIPTLIVTGYDFTMRELTEDPERYNVLSKPIRSHELVEAVRTALERRQGDTD
jgi:two-component system, response regulator, stage 0 sporulation protein F